MTHALLLPVVALIIWSLVMMLWLYATRLPAIRKARISFTDPDAARAAMEKLPAGVRAVADNYNHLMEQPTIFYALVLAMAVGGIGTQVDVGLAWAYVGLRVVHSFLQVADMIPRRFLVFMLSSIVLIVLTLRTLLALL